MIIRRLVIDSGDFRCFEVNNSIISKNGMAQIASILEGVEVIRHPKFNDGEIFCEFIFRGKKFLITEPFGDSSVYDVYSLDDAQQEIALIADHFESSAPIRGGDVGYTAFSIVSWLFGAGLWVIVLFYAYKFFKYMFS